MSTMTHAAPASDQNPALSEAKPFAWVSLGWLGLALAVCWARSPQPAVLGWLGLVWLLAVADLAITAGAIGALLRLTTVSEDNRMAASVQAFTWGAVKLACLGVFVVLLVNGTQIPVSSLLLGLGTMIVVPILGGLWWSQRIFKHA